jgi:hypothetical protein
MLESVPDTSYIGDERIAHSTKSLWNTFFVENGGFFMEKVEIK